MTAVFVMAETLIRTVQANAVERPLLTAQAHALMVATYHG